MVSPFSSHLPELILHVLPIHWMTGDQRLVRTAASDRTIFNKVDAIRVDDGAQAVGNDNRCPAVHQLVQGFLHHHFRLRVQASGCFVQNQQLRIPQECPGDGQPLALTAGDLNAPFTDFGIQPRRHGLNKIFGVGHI